MAASLGALSLSVLDGSSGSSYELGLPASAPVAKLQETLTSLSGIPLHRQLIIHRGTRLSPNDSIGDLSPAHPLLLYDKARLASPSPPLAPPLPSVPLERPACPPEPSTSIALQPTLSEWTVDSTSREYLRSYDEAFRWHSADGRAIATAADARLGVAKRLLGVSACGGENPMVLIIPIVSRVPSSLSSRSFSELSLAVCLLPFSHLPSLRSRGSCPFASKPPSRA